MVEKEIGGDNNEKKDKNLPENETPIAGEMEFRGGEKKFQTMFNADLVYDEEIYNKFNMENEIQEEEDNDQTLGTNLVSALNIQDNLYEVSLLFYMVYKKKISFRPLTKNSKMRTE